MSLDDELIVKPLTQKHWSGTAPKHCELCHGKFTDGVFIDGSTCYGPWAIMCSCCHSHSGHGLGLGRGQKYDSKTLVKLEG
jgi:hypothetical protein